jgi:3D (Asp-Asp-Asp) domain-containing protein
MAPRLIIAAPLLTGATLVAQPTATKLNVHVMHFGYPGDSKATHNTRLGLGDHNNILNPDSVAVTPDLDRVFPFGSKVYIAGKFLGFRHATLSSKLHHTIAVYDPKGDWTGDFDSYVEPSHERPRLNFVVQHLLGLKEALIRCFVAMSFSRSVVELLGD